MDEFFKLLTFILLMHGECRGESFESQIAVAQVVFNRGIDKTTVDYKQFNCFNKRKIRKAILNENKIVVLKEIWNKVPVLSIMKYVYIYQFQHPLKTLSDGSTYYWTKDAHKHMKRKYPKWLKSLHKTKISGNHIFFKEKK